MAITGACLVLFVTFHVLMNSVALLWPAAYNVICEFLGANWYALVASAGLALLFIIHIIYALWLTLQNRRARGADRYAVNTRPPQVEWSSKNMLVLGIVVVAFLAVHLIQFWAKMQLQELISHYIIGFIALWFHMNHGFWSMFHTVGWNNNIWISRLKTISCWWTTIVVLLFTAQAVLFTVQAHNKFFLNDATLQEQYAEYWAEKADALIEEFQSEAAALQNSSDNMLGQQKAQMNFFVERGDYYTTQANAIKEYAAAQAPSVSNQSLQQIGQFASFITAQTERAKQMNQTPEPSK